MGKLPDDKLKEDLNSIAIKFASGISSIRRNPFGERMVKEYKSPANNPDE
jgi:hypothetical protein